MDEYQQIHHRMTQIQQEKSQKIQTNRRRAGTDPQLKTVMEWLKPVVSQFVAGDSALDVQSVDGSDIFVGYALISVCRIRATVEKDWGRIEVRGDDFQSAKSFEIPADKNALTAWLGQALLDWYETLF